MRDIQNQLPQAIGQVTPTNVNRSLLVNREVEPFNNPEVRRAMALALDRKAFIDTLTEGKGDVGGARRMLFASWWGPSLLAPICTRPFRPKSRPQCQLTATSRTAPNSDALPGQ
jgi:ABC-type transport system substrate-binding protein